MKSIRRALQAVAMLVPTALAIAPDARAGGMDAFAWSKRPVVIFAASDTDAMANRQRDVFANERAEIEDRDMVVLTVWPDRIEGTVEGVSAADMRISYGVQPGEFAVLLIGKDTGVKRRSNDTVALDDLFSQIDGMPMRRREMLGN